jgi:hypothetical protein
MPRIKITTKKLDDLFRDIMRSQGECHRCLRRSPHVILQCAHGFSRRYRGTRWTEEANFCLCSGCHMFFTWRPIEWDDYMRNVWGEEKYDRLRAQAQAITKPDKGAIYIALKERLEQIHEGNLERPPGVRDDEGCP